MSGYEIKFSGVDRLYDAYSWRLTRRAKKVWKSGQVLQGQYLKELETKIAKKYKRKFAVGVASATDGLYFAMKVLGIQKGHTVMCPVLSYIATAGAIRRTGADIQYVDTNRFGNIGDLEYKEKPNAVLYVNLFGNCADYDRLSAYCKKNKIPLIEDAAQSQGAYYNGKPSGKLGDISVFSFDPMKNMPSFGGGGMVLTDDEEHYKKLLSIRRCSRYNSLLADDHAHQLLLFLDKFKKLQNMREKIYLRYKENLQDADFLDSEEEKPSYHKLVMLTNKRNELKEFLATNGIQTKIHYSSVLDNNKIGIYQYPYAENISVKAISLPIYPYLKIDEVDYICEKIKEFYGV